MPAPELPFHPPKGNNALVPEPAPLKPTGEQRPSSAKEEWIFQNPPRVNGAAPASVHFVDSPLHTYSANAGIKENLVPRTGQLESGAVQLSCSPKTRLL